MRTPLCVVLAACAAAASADITILNENRTFSMSVQGQSDFGGDQNSSLYFGSESNDDPFVPWTVGDALFTNGAQSAIASASGDFSTVISHTAFTAVASLAGSATILDETGHSADAAVQALMEISFTLDTGALWRLTAAGAGDTRVALAAGPNPGSPSIFDSAAGSIDEVFFLAAGDYTLTFAASVAAGTFEVGTVSAATTLDAALVMVPAPGVPLALAAALPLARRRRGA